MLGGSDLDAERGGTNADLSAPEGDLAAGAADFSLSEELGAARKWQPVLLRLQLLARAPAVLSELAVTLALAPTAGAAGVVEAKSHRDGQQSF